jgi:hypothetical protein
VVGGGGEQVCGRGVGRGVSGSGESDGCAPLPLKGTKSVNRVYVVGGEWDGQSRAGEWAKRSG